MTNHEIKLDNILERTFWIGAMVAVANRERAHLDGELGQLAFSMLRQWRPKARA